MLLYTDGKYRYSTYPGRALEKRPLGGQTELQGIRTGQIWEIERRKDKPWLRYEVTCISRVGAGTYDRRADYYVYLHQVKSRRLIVKTIGSLIKKRGCRLVQEAPVAQTSPAQPGQP